MGGLADLLRRRIESDGPLSVAEYMAVALGHPRFGYYMVRDPFGSAGDFTTAPEISQMFGELIGLWCAALWESLGRPEPVNLVELGPGRGTLIADMLRAARTVLGFMPAISLHLVETSPLLREKQRRLLEGISPSWHDSLEGVPAGPLLVIANEFFDALPIRQFQRAAGGWRERLVDGDEKGFKFVLSEQLAPDIPAQFAAAPEGAIIEVCPLGLDIAASLGERVARFGGGALIVDYGHPTSAIGDTLQAVRNHAYHDVLADPGEADLTAHVDFAALARAAAGAGGRVHGPLAQGEFLGRLGLAARAEALLGGATEAQAKDIRFARDRLAGEGRMGTLFKVLAISGAELPPPPGF